MLWAVSMIMDGLCMRQMKEAHIMLSQNIRQKKMD